MARVLDDHYHTAPMPLHTFLDPPEEEDDLELQRFDSHRQHFDPLDYDTKPILAEEPISPDSPNPTTARGKSTEEVSYAKLVPLTICLCLATFCLSLVSSLRRSLLLLGSMSPWVSPARRNHITSVRILPLPSRDTRHLTLLQDGTILATAIPKITNSFNSLDDVGWYGSSFLFTNCTVQLFFGKLYTFYSAKWVFLSGLGIFEIGSLVCAIAPNSVSLIIGRAIAGIGAAGLFSGAIIIIANTVPLRIRPIYIGILSSMHSIASVAGPILGGAFTDHLTWRWCFWINLPLGGLTAIGIFFLMPTRAGDVQPLPWKEQVKQFDLPGTLTMIPSIICLLLALQWGGSKYDWKNARIIVLMILFALLFAAFVGIQIWQKDRATVPVRLMKNRSVFGAAWYACCISAPMFVVAYYVRPRILSTYTKQPLR